MTEESAVKVCVRVRPLIAREESTASENTEPVHLFWKADKNSIHQVDDGNSTKTFSFDRVFTAEETTNQLYQDIAKPLVVSTVEGYNGTIFAYGQTSSGKTFTMMGGDHIIGVIPLAVEDVFHTIKNCPKKEFLLRVSYMEIYNETVTDLLVDSWKRKPLEVREAINKNIYVADLTEELVTSPAQALAWIRKGEKNRHYGKTKMNQRSSRSHTIFRMIIESRERSDPASGENADGAIIVSHLNLVDLAGSERASQTGAEGTRFKEGCNINRSLFILGQVIKKLTDESQKGFTNYRDSKLTRILQNSLGGNAKTVIICTITPVTLDETLSTLQFASTAKKMKNDPHVTEVSDDGALLKRYRNEIVDLKRRLHEVSSVTQTTATEKEFLSQLLQEKDQLRIEQEDRIRNLTKLLVTSSNLFPVKKMPKRRVTWGGKLLRLAHPSACGAGSSDLSFAETSRKRKADCSCLTELADDDEDFDAHWEIPDGPSDEMEMSQTSVTVRSFGESPKDFSCPDWMPGLSGKVTNLELQLKMGSQQKEEAMKKVESLDGRVAELQLQLDMESQQKEEAMTKVESLDGRVAELQLQLDMESQQKEEAMTKVESLDGRVAELQLQLEMGSQQEEEAMTKVESLDGRVAELQLQLDMESQQKEEVTTKVESLDGRVAELQLQLDMESKQKEEAMTKVESLELQLQTEAGQNREAWEKLQTAEQWAAELQQQTAAQQKLEAEEKVLMLDLKVADLERRLEEQSHSQAQNEQMRKEFAETIQLCETLASEKDVVAAERDYLKQELGMFIEQTERLEKDKDALSHELEEKSETDEFKSLEEEFRKEYENELQNKISTLKRVIESSEVQRQELQNKVETLSVELKKKSEFAEELQSMSGKDLLQEVAELRRSVDDAEGVSRDTKKEWAFLRSQNISLEETNVTLTANHDKMEAEVNSLRSQLSTEKSRYRGMESDLQKGLNVAFAENTKLTALLDGKVPKDLLDRVELESVVANLSKELTVSREAEGALGAQLEELASLHTLPEKVDNLMKQVCELTEDLCAVQTQRDGLLSAQAQCQEEAQQLRGFLETSQDELVKVQADLVAAALREQELLQQCADVTQRSDAERSQLVARLEDTGCKLEESDQQRTSLVDRLSEMQHKVQALEEMLADSEAARSTEEEIGKELQEQMKQLTEELQVVRAECQQQKAAEQSEQLRTALQHDVDTSLTQEIQTETLLTTGAPSSAELLSALTTVTAERDQLKTDLQENVEMMIENQEELRTALEKNREHRERIRQLETTRTSTQDGSAQLEPLQTHIMQLQATLQEVGEQRSQLERELQHHMEMAAETQSLLQLLQEQNQSSIELERQSEERRAQLQQEVAEKQCLLQSLQEELNQQKHKHSDLLKQCEERERDSQQQTKSLSEQLESARAERDSLLCEKDAGCRGSSEEKQQQQQQQQQLLSRVTSLCEESDQLQETLQGLRQDRQQLRAELEDKIETMKTLTEKLELSESERDRLLCEEEASCQRVTRLSEERDQLQETLQQLRAELEDKIETMKTLTEKLELSESERDSLLCEEEASCQRVTRLSEERDQLQETLQQLRAELEDKIETMKTLTEKLELSESERDSLLCEEEASCQRVTCLSEERDQLQGTLQQLRAELETLHTEMKTLTEKLELSESERDRLLCEEEASCQRVTCLSEERDQLQETLLQLRAELETLQTEASTTQELLQSVQEELCEQQQLNSDLQRLNEEKESSLDQQIKTLTEKLEIIESERDGLLCEEEASCQRVTCVSEERDELQETLLQLRAELEDKMETISAIQEKLREQQQQPERVEQEAKLQQELLSEANTTISALREQLSNLDGGFASSRLLRSTEQLQETFVGFQQLIDTCSKHISTPMDEILRVPGSMKYFHLPSLPETNKDTYTSICKLGLQTVQTLGYIMVRLRVQAQNYRNCFEELVKKDLAVFEERRLQDVLLCRVQAPSLSVSDADLHTVWATRLTELLDKRQLYQQKMSSILEQLWANVAPHPSGLSAEVTERKCFKEQLQDVFATQPISYSRFNSILSCELQRRAALAHSKTLTLQGIADEQSGLSEELKLLEAQAHSQLRAEESRTSTLLQVRDGAALKTELSLLKDHQQLLLQLQQTEETVKALREHSEQLEEAQVRAHNMVSNHKQATQLLQTELQNCQAQSEEKENTIQTLRSKLRESEKKASPSAAELEKLKTRLFKMEAELSSASDKHHQQVQRMTTALNEKEDSLRKLKETVRRSQQQGEESFLQGQELHDKLTNPRGLVIKSSILLDKAKLEEEVKRLHLKITELERSLSAQHTEIGKWKNRAIKLKARSKHEVDKPLSPCTPTKRGPPLTSDPSSFLCSPKRFLVTPRNLLDSPRNVLDSPRKLLDSPRKLPDSPKVSLLHSPKSRFFDVGGTSELLSQSCPRQFFDNSSLGTIPDAAAGAARKDEWCPQSPKQEDMCKTQ
ncbi:centromere-associated protein E isoform X2 [Scophthalmus maximus]|uniref:centromere-associated protein E isoform X2 n=1 Tax=Scophthalmus maximus TaxID=52904 RepID=UPI001FA8B3B3|nr:centromere-associated protein E isoform X2 [Scophthalmus maximus]